MESLKFTNKLKMAALDKKLDMYQAAYVHWIKLVQSLETDQMDNGKLVNNKLEENAMIAREWWENNCLFLGNDARQAFHFAVTGATFYTYTKNFLIEKEIEKRLETDPIKLKEVEKKVEKIKQDAEESRKKVMELGEYLTRDVGVLHLGKDEYDPPKIDK